MQSENSPQLENWQAPLDRRLHLIVNGRPISLPRSAAVRVIVTPGLPGPEPVETAPAEPYTVKVPPLPPPRTNVPKRPGISETTLRAAEIRYSDYPEPGSTEITYWTSDGEITQFKRWRLPTVRANGQKYHQEPGSGVYAYFPPGFFRRRREPLFGLATDSVVLVEGEFKELALLELGVYAIGLPSFNVYLKDENEHRQLLRDLRVTFSREKIKAIYFLGDADTATNFEFSRQAAFLASAAFPAQVFLPRIPLDAPKGIDDCKEALGAAFGEFFCKLITEAIPVERKCDATSLALLLFEREAERIKALQGIERERQFKRIVRMAGAAQSLGETDATARLRKLATEVIGITQRELKVAVEVEQSKAYSDDGDGQEPAQPVKSIELELVDRLLEILPPIITRNDDWFVYQDGIWAPRRRHHYAPEALNIIAPAERSERLAAAVLRHIEGRCQAKESPFCGAYKFDGDDILVSVANGVLRIGAEITLEDVAKEHYFTQKLAAPFEPKARCTAFSKALAANLPNKLDRQLFGLFFASLFVPDCRWEASLCCYGEAGTGKSTLVEGVEAAVGKGPCQALSLTQLCDPESYNAHDLEYAMLNFSTELNALELTSDRFKQLVSGETVPVRPIYREPYYIKPTCKYAFLTNHLPRFKDGSGAELRRLRFLKFAHVPARKDLQLKKLVASEQAGILNFLVTLVPELLKSTEMPHGSRASAMARERFKLANDPVGAFVKTECHLRRNAFEPKDRLTARFEAFISHHGLSEKISKSFLKQLYERYNAHPSRLWDGGQRKHVVTGIELKSSTESNL